LPRLLLVAQDPRQRSLLEGVLAALGLGEQFADQREIPVRPGVVPERPDHVVVVGQRSYLGAQVGVRGGRLRRQRYGGGEGEDDGGDTVATHGRDLLVGRPSSGAGRVCEI
jgi:hypothetical protein